MFKQDAEREVKTKITEERKMGKYTQDARQLLNLIG